MRACAIATVFIVDAHGHIVAYPDTRDMVPGRNVISTSPVAKQVMALPQDLRATQTTQFPAAGQGHGAIPIEMIGTYSTIPELRWAVIAQRSLDDARIDAGVDELTAEALRFVVGVTFASLLHRLPFRAGHHAADSRPGGIDARHQPRGIPRARGGARRRGNQRARRNVQQHGRGHRAIRRSAQGGRGTRIASSSSARFACSPRPSTKRTRTRAAIPGAWRNIRSSSATGSA